MKEQLTNQEALNSLKKILEETSRLESYVNPNTDFRSETDSFLKTLAIMIKKLDDDIEREINELEQQNQSIHDYSVADQQAGVEKF